MEEKCHTLGLKGLHNPNPRYSFPFFSDAYSFNAKKISDNLVQRS